MATKKPTTEVASKALPTTSKTKGRKIQEVIGEPIKQTALKKQPPAKKMVEKKIVPAGAAKKPTKAPMQIPARPVNMVLESPVEYPTLSVKKATPKKEENHVVELTAERRDAQPEAMAAALLESLRKYSL